MADIDLFDLRATHNSHRWFLPVTQDVTVGPPGKKFLFGGVGLASSITAMERTTGRPAIWATAQYLSFANPPSIVDLDVIVPRSGNNVTQARVVGHVADSEIFTVNAALGERANDVEGQWANMPSVPPPQDCPAMPRWNPSDKDMHDKIDLRVAKGRYGDARGDGQFSEDGHAVLWARGPAGTPMTSGLLAIVADFVPSATGHALGRHAGANSLDNTIRLRQLVETEWMCLDIRIHGVRSGFVHGRMHIFSQDGVLMATASQSAILRLFQPRPAVAKPAVD
jgi:acyl-CoA thioesterase